MGFPKKGTPYMSRTNNYDHPFSIITPFKRDQYNVLHTTVDGGNLAPICYSTVDLQCKISSIHRMKPSIHCMKSKTICIYIYKQSTVGVACLCLAVASKLPSSTAAQAAARLNQVVGYDIWGIGLRV